MVDMAPCLPRALIPASRSACIFRRLLVPATSFHDGSQAASCKDLLIAKFNHAAFIPTPSEGPVTFRCREPRRGRILNALGMFLAFGKRLGFLLTGLSEN